MQNVSEVFFPDKLTPHHHEERANDERFAASPSVKPNERWNSHDDIDDILNGGCQKVGGAGVSRHAEHVGDVIHHNAATRWVQGQHASQK